MDLTLLIPLLLCLAGALVALAWRLALPEAPSRLVGWILALFPLAAFILLLTQIPGKDVPPRSLIIPWMPTLGLNFSLYLDGLSALFALLVTGIGVLVLVYAGYYLSGDPGAPRFNAYLLLFMAAMLGLVLAGDLLTLWFCWEGTSITSFLLIGYKQKDPAARAAALKSLFITGGGGIVLLGGVLWAGALAGGVDYQTILTSGDLFRNSPWYVPLFALFAFGAFTKSAQAPAHIWLPQAMSAPTPASAYLHSATMVKAGVYLLARLNPALGQTNEWFWTLSLVGLATMLLGAYQGFKQNDLKGLLAYSTVSQLGAMVMLIGQDTDIAFKALVITVLAHALYKSALFLVAGSVDHGAGTRDLRRLGGLRLAMPFTAAAAVIAGLSMGGLPPLFGFLAKETLLASITHPNIPEAVNFLFPAAAVIAGSLLLAQAGLVVWDTFFGRQRDASIHAHEAPWPMILAPGIPAILSLLVGGAPEPVPVADFLASAAGAAYGGPVKVSLALWTGINPPLILSAVAITIGALLLTFRARLRGALAASPIVGRISFDRVHDIVIMAFDGIASLATRTQAGQLRLYLAVIMGGTLVLVLAFGGVPLPDDLTPLNLIDELAILRLFTLLLAAGAALLSVFLRRDFPAILALGASGLAVAVMMALEPAPDVALVQVVVDLLSVVILTITLSNMPRAERERASEFTFKQSRPGLIRDALIAIGSALLVAALTLVALDSRPRFSAMTPFYEAYAKPGVGASDIVGAIVIDFRGFDTLIEIAVFAMAGLAIFTLLRYAAHKPWIPAHALHPDEIAEDKSDLTLPVLGIAGGRTSPLVRVLGFALLPLSCALGAVHIMYGHNQGGDGFTAAVIVGLAVAFWYVAFGYAETQIRLWWLRPARMIIGGLALALLNGAAAAIFAGGFFANFDYGKALGLVLPEGFHLSTSFVFEFAIFSSVLGGVSFILEALGHPKDRPVEMGG
jgi:NADH:ubiquinone oxidoreductase subunit 5 (subunit L)/multisubunit Na+/H+ antiporter MnhA subunit/multisubunit Na+/H+ antiporter MnhB subunit